MNSDIEKMFLTADRNLNCNTAYPIFKEEFKKYEAVIDVMEGVTQLSYYIHIPFCKHLCKFCEYTRFLAGDKDQERRYVDLLEKQIRKFVSEHRIEKIYGLDIGGGTPTSLEDDDFEKVLKLAKYLLNGGENDEGIKPQVADDFESSIEISFTTINDKKIELIGEYGFKRVSAGIQSMSRTFLEKQGRAFNKVYEISDYMKALYREGVEKINLDLMYGMPEQNDDMIHGTLDVVEQLKPEQVTIYEMRYNRVKNKPDNISRELQFRQYSIMYNRLIAMGYRGRFGKNTFTRCNDNGVSSYLWYRMDQGIPYKGFGISSQSMGKKGISYGSLKNTDIGRLPELGSIDTTSNYCLPKSEMAAKYVSIAMYNGSFRLDSLSEILGEDAETFFSDELSYLMKKRYITKKDNYIVVTEAGFRFYGAIAALFWSDSQKTKLMKTIKEDEI